MVDTAIAKNLIPFVREIDADNSCLFSSIGYLVDREHFNNGTSQKLRQIVHDCIKADPDKYNQAILGVKPEKYLKNIIDPDIWGGAIEAQILAEHFKCEIIAYNIHDLSSVVYGEGQDYNKRVYLAYDGRHYNALVMVIDYRAFPEHDVCLFLPEDFDTLTKFQTLIEELHKTHKRFKKREILLICQDCYILFQGEKKAQNHCDNFGHSNFKPLK